MADPMPMTVSGVQFGEWTLGWPFPSPCGMRPKENNISAWGYVFQTNRATCRHASLIGLRASIFVFDSIFVFRFVGRPRCSQACRQSRSRAHGIRKSNKFPSGVVDVWFKPPFWFKLPFRFKPPFRFFPYELDRFRSLRSPLAALSAVGVRKNKGW